MSKREIKRQTGVELRTSIAAYTDVFVVGRESLTASGGDGVAAL